MDFLGAFWEPLEGSASKKKKLLHEHYDRES